MEKQEMLEEIKRLSGEVQRMTDGGYEKSTLITTFTTFINNEGL